VIRNERFANRVIRFTHDAPATSGSKIAKKSN
jgi:hypothetical protein